MKRANLCNTSFWDDLPNDFLMPDDNTDFEERWDGFGDQPF
jgi:hypothetical protein